VNVETKEQSNQWSTHIYQIRQKSLNRCLPARKQMAAVFWVRKGVLMVDFMQQGMTIMSELFCETLKKLCRAIQRKRRGMLTCGVMLLHDNACPHTAARTQALLEHFNLELFEHPPSLQP
jgi:hypothetical protein